VFSSTPTKDISPQPCPSSTASVPIFSTSMRFVLLLQSCQHTVQYMCTSLLLVICQRTRLRRIRKTFNPSAWELNLQNSEI
jgi:hypothetical protein